MVEMVDRCVVVGVGLPDCRFLYYIITICYISSLNFSSYSFTVYLFVLFCDEFLQCRNAAAGRTFELLNFDSLISCFCSMLCATDNNGTNSIISDVFGRNVETS